MKLILAFILLSVGNLWAFDGNNWKMKDGIAEHAIWEIEMSTFSPIQYYYLFTDGEKDALVAVIEGKHDYKVKDITGKYDKDVVVVSSNTVFTNFDDLRKTMTDKNYIKDKLVKEGIEYIGMEMVEIEVGIDMTDKKETKQKKLSHLKKVYDKLP